MLFLRRALAAAILFSLSAAGLAAQKRSETPVTDAQTVASLRMEGCIFTSTFVVPLNWATPEAGTRIVISPGDMRLHPPATGTAEAMSFGASLSIPRTAAPARLAEAAERYVGLALPLILELNRPGPDPMPVKRMAVRFVETRGKAIGLAGRKLAAGRPLIAPFFEDQPQGVHPKAKIYGDFVETRSQQPAGIRISAEYEGTEADPARRRGAILPPDSWSPPFETPGGRRSRPLPPARPCRGRMPRCRALIPRVTPRLSLKRKQVS